MRIAIHQPNFMPWYPFFQKIINSDIFVLLTHCQFEKNNFQNRFNIDDKWQTMSVSKKIERIKDKKYLSPEKDWNKIKIRLNNPLLSKFDKYINSSLCETNIGIIEEIMTTLNIKTKLEIDYDTDLLSTHRLVDICKHFNADCYYSGTSGTKYLDIELFNKENIKVEFQKQEDMIKKPILDMLC